MDKLLVTFGGIVGIGLIYWFFFSKKEKSIDAKTSWNILVEGGYQPSRIAIPHGKQSTITFTRRDPNSCLEDVIIEDFKIKQFLPLNKPVTIMLSPGKTGTFGMHCAMNMFHGKIIVV
jgi:plastocyanin domain-containing protein